jgi:transcriptional regulator with XRE-family HTH domain
VAPGGGARRVPGLRREEVARLAGVSTGYHTHLEQGRHPDVSAAVLDAVARALRLATTNAATSSTSPEPFHPPQTPSAGTRAARAPGGPSDAGHQRWWYSHRVAQWVHGTQRFHHPLVGEFALHHETLAFPSDPGRTVCGYTAEPGTASAQALALLAGWSAPDATRDDAGARAHRPCGTQGDP